MNKKQNGKPKLSKDTLKTAKRLLKYVTETYKMRFILVFVCILISSVATISVSLSLKFLLDDFIIPLIGQQSPNFTELYRALEVLGCIFLLGVVSTFIYTRMMVYIGQGVLKKVRDDMFEHMQTLPIRYFDQRTNGSIMSLGIESASDNSGCCSYFCYDFCYQKDRWEQWKVFCQPADVSGRCNRLCGRAHERTESCQGI